MYFILNLKEKVKVGFLLVVEIRGIYWFACYWGEELDFKFIERKDVI